MPGISADLELVASDALRTVDEVGAALEQRFGSAAQAFQVALVDALNAVAGEAVAVTADTTAIEADIAAAVDASAADVAVSADTAEIAPEIETAAAAADAETVVTADSSEVIASIDQAVLDADSTAIIEADTASIGFEIENAVAAAESQVDVTTDAAALTAEIDAALTAADTTIEVDADAAQVTDAIEEAVSQADTSVSVAVEGGGDLSEVASNADDLAGSLGAGALGASAMGGELSGVVTKAAGIAGITVGVGALAGFLQDGAQQAIELEAATDRLTNIFGPAIGPLIDISADAAEQLNLTDDEVLNLASSIGALLAPSGLAQDRLADLAEETLRAGADMSAFTGFTRGSDEAILALTAGVRGQARALRPYGIVLDETSVKAEAMRLGFKAVDGEFDENEFRVARLNVIMKQLKDQGIIGLFDATDNLAKRQIRANKAWEDAKDNLAGSLAPAMVTATEAAADLLTALGEVPGIIEEINRNRIIDIDFPDLPDLAALVKDIPPVPEQVPLFPHVDTDIESLERLKDAKREVNEAFAEGIPDTGQTDAQIEAAAALKVELDVATGSIEDGDKAFKAYVETLGLTVDEYGLVIEKTKQTSKETAMLGLTTDDATTILGELAAAVKDVRTEFDLLQGRSISLAEAEINVRQDAQEFLETLAGGKQTTDEVVSAALQQVAGFEQLREAHVNAGHSAEEADAQFALLEASLLGVMQQTGETEEAQRSYLIALGLTPAQVDTILALPTEQQVSAAMTAIQGQLAIFDATTATAEVKLEGDEAVTEFINSTIEDLERLGRTAIVSFGNIPPFAPREHGGITQPGEFTLVGERGPEFAVFPAGTRIIPADQTAQIIAGQGGGQVTQNVVVNEVSQDPLATAEAVAARIGQAASR